MNTPEDLKFARTHEWIRLEDDIVTVGISDHAQSLLGDMVYVELPEVDDYYEIGDDLSLAESVKAASDIYAPVSGTVIEVNELLEDSPEFINSDAYGTGWICRIKLDDVDELDELLTAEEYNNSIED